MNFKLLQSVANILRSTGYTRTWLALQDLIDRERAKEQEVTVELDAAGDLERLLLEREGGPTFRLWVRVVDENGPSGWPVVQVKGPRDLVEDYVGYFWHPLLDDVSFESLITQDDGFEEYLDGSGVEVSILRRIDVSRVSSSQGLCYDLPRAKREGLYERLTFVGRADTLPTLDDAFAEAFITHNDLGVNVPPNDEQVLDDWGSYQVRYVYGYGPECKGD